MGIETILASAATLGVGVIGFFLKRHIKIVDAWISKLSEIESKQSLLAEKQTEIQKQMATALDNQALIFNIRIDTIQNTMVEIKTVLVEQQKILQQMDRTSAVTNSTLERFISLEERVLALEQEKKFAK